MAERAGLENRSPGNWTASSNLAPSATESGDIFSVLRMTENRPNSRDIREIDFANRLSQRDDWADMGVLSLWGSWPV